MARAWSSVRPSLFPILLLLLLYHEVSGSGPRKRRRHLTPADEFTSHSVIHPRVFHARSKREIKTTLSDVIASRGRHLDHLTVTFEDEDEREFVLDLQLNRQLIPENYFQRTHKQVGTFWQFSFLFLILSNLLLFLQQI